MASTTEGSAAAPSSQAQPKQPGGMSITARVIVFVAVPVAFGFMGFAISYLQAMTDPLHEIDVKRDFVYPWLLAAALVTVVGFRTGGFRRGVGQKRVVANPGINVAKDKKKRQ